LSYRLRVKGHEHIPKEGGAVLICNHVSFVDWLIVAAGVKRPVRFVMDHAFFKGWLLKRIMTRAKVIPIAGGREDPARLEKAYEMIAAELAAGEVVCIFPEGKITYDGKLSAFKPGVMKIVRHTPVPIVPMALRGLW
ncbi:1-acyl-sn-glycerol-3-phosphate acyltransferase, partial [Staphylococcus epidermidis]|uniref:1-acyl-sn-glycerol-3-phosphate acyltransferase n=1 Tax=Staphylococcus epidermidis TaxID=1282 RepID=UPI0027389B17